MQLIANDAERHGLGKRALQTLEVQRGATQRTLARLKNLLAKDPSEVVQR
jgi:hypothetical protein